MKVKKTQKEVVASSMLAMIRKIDKLQADYDKQQAKAKKSLPKK